MGTVSMKRPAEAGGENRVSGYEENAILAYYQKIKEGSVIVGQDIRLLYDVIIQGLEDKRWFFDQRKATNVIRFFERYVHHNKGKLAPQRLKLELWQRASLSLVYGIVDQSGKRQFTEVMWLIGRKMGKTLLAGGCADFEAFVDGEFGSEIYFLAPKLTQAELCYSAAKFNIEKEPDLAKRTKSTKTGLYIKESNTTLQKLPFAEKTSDGFNPMLFIADEVAAWPAAKGLAQWEAMTSGTGAREQPLGVAISSANFVDDGIFDELVKRGTAFLKGRSEESHILPILYRIDDVSKWDDINELQKSLPGLGVSVSVSFVLDQIAIAHESLSKKREFITKFCNIKQNSSSAWLNTDDVRKSFNLGKKSAEDYAGKPWHQKMLAAGKIDEEGNHFTLDDFARCYGVAGIDLSQTTDLTACSLMIQREGVIYYFVKFFMPRAKLEEATERDGIPYQIYVEKGLLELSGENFVDYEDCFRWFKELKERYRIYVLQIGLDRYCAQYLQKELEGYGYHCDTVYQGTNLTGVINTCEGMIKDGMLQSADGNDLMKIHWLGAAMKIVNERNQKMLCKMKANTHVDGVAATLDALCMRGNIWNQYKARLENPERAA